MLVSRRENIAPSCYGADTREPFPTQLRWPSSVAIQYERKILRLKISFSATDAELEIWVTAKDFARSRSVFNQQLRLMQSGMLRSFGDISESVTGGAITNEIAEAVASSTEHHMSMEFQLWAGSDLDVAQFLRSSLAENDILSRMEVQDMTTSIWVPLAHISRAKEIRQEIVGDCPSETADSEA